MTNLVAPAWEHSVCSATSQVQRHRGNQYYQTTTSLDTRNSSALNPGSLQQPTGLKGPHTWVLQSSDLLLREGGPGHSALLRIHLPHPHSMATVLHLL